MHAGRVEAARVRAMTRLGRGAAHPVQTPNSTGLVSELLYLQRSAGNSAVAQQLSEPVTSRPSLPGPDHAVVVQRVELTKTDKRYIKKLDGKPNQARAKQRIKEFTIDEAAWWYFITAKLPDEKEHEFLTNVYHLLGDNEPLDKLVDLRNAFDKQQQSMTGPTVPPNEPPSQTKEKVLKQGGVRVMNVDPGLVKLKPMGGPGLGPGRGPQSVPRPTGGGEQKPVPQLGSGVFGELADLFSLNLDAMWQTWKQALTPEFDLHVSGNLVPSSDVKLTYLALKNDQDPRDVEDLAPEVLHKQLGGNPDDVNLVQVIESNDPTVAKVSNYLIQRYSVTQSLKETFQQWKSTTLLYNAFAWSAAKHGGAGPTNVAPSSGHQGFTWLKQGSSSVTTRVYLTTAGSVTQTVATELRDGWSGQKGLPASAYEGLKYAGAGAAADRRDAIVIYVSDLDAVLDTIARYQNDANRRNHFLNERVRLSRPASLGACLLPGVGIADHPPGEKSFSQLATGAVLKALQGAKGSQSEFLRLLPLALVEVGLDPTDPSRLLRK